MRRLALVIGAALLLHATPSRAVQPDEVLPDAMLEQRARHLSRELRCMVCQNQSIDDSDAPLARDLRLLVRERLKAGDSDQQVLDFLTVRYGDFVLLRPPLNWRTALLWGMPLGTLIVGGVVAFITVRRHRRNSSTEGSANHAMPLTLDEEARIAALLQKAPDQPPAR